MTTEKTPDKGKKATGKKFPDTVRARKRGKLANTQRYIPFSEIRNDTVILKNGGLRAVLRIEPLNFNLKSETEQQGIIAGYESFINTVNFPVQIIIRSTKVNIDPYLKKIHTQADQLSSDLMKEQALAYATFIQKIVEVADIMQKEFYIVIPLDDVAQKTNVFNQFFSWLHIDDSLGKALQRNKRFTGELARLKERIDVIETGLNNIGLATRQLKTMELIRLYYRVYNPGVSQTQKLGDEQELHTEQNVL